MSSTPTKNDEATRRAAVLVSTLDPQIADLLLEKMTPDQAQRVRNAIMQLDHVSSEEEEMAVADFLDSTGRNEDSEDGIELAGSLAEKLAASSLQATAAEPIADVDRDRELFHFLQDATPDILASHLGSEHPQVVAVVVAHLPPQRAAEMIKCLDSRLQVDVLRRVAELDVADRSILIEVEQQLKVLLADEIRATRNRASGVAAVSSILSAAGTDGNSLWNNVGQHDQSLVRLLRQHSDKPEAEVAKLSQSQERREEKPQPHPQPHPQIHPERRTVARVDRVPASRPNAASVVEVTDEGPAAQPVDFASLAELSDRDLSALFQRLPSDLLLLSLAGASPSFVKRLFKPLPGRESRALRRRMASVGPLRLTDIERAQAQVMTMAGQLARDGLIDQLPAARFAAAA
jgi:flagellar motor switch protein FliG